MYMDPLFFLGGSSMRSSYKKTATAVSTMLASLGALRMTSADATLIENDQSAVVDGWNITAPTGVSLSVTTNDNELFIEKSANFTEPNQGFQVGFQAVANGGSLATSIDFTDETIQNNTGQAFSGFDFILLNTGSSNATFPSNSNVFKPPSGTGYAYTSVNLNSAGDLLSYTGTQDAGSTSSWGSAAAGDNLLIDAPAGADFSLKELSESGGGGGVSSVPLPSATSQSLAGLVGLALFGAIRHRRRRSIAAS
jgi:MYXO-CTERM domain-containing protein